MKTPFLTESERLEAFSDGVIAVIITIMVLELKPPHGTDLNSLRASSGIDGRAMWANLHLLFWLSLVPFTTSWLGENPSAAVPTALYAFGLLMDAIAYTILQNALRRLNGPGTGLAKAIETDLKGKLSLALYVCAIGFAFVSPLVSDALFVVVAGTWIVPDRRFEPVIADRG